VRQPSATQHQRMPRNPEGIFAIPLAGISALVQPEFVTAPDRCSAALQAPIRSRGELMSRPPDCSVSSHQSPVPAGGEAGKVVGSRRSSKDSALELGLHRSMMP